MGCNAVPPGVRLHCAGLEHDLTVAHATLSTTSRLLTPHQQRHRHSCRSQRPLEGTTVNEINGVNKPSSTESVITPTDLCASRSVSRVTQHEHVYLHRQRHLSPQMKREPQSEGTPCAARSTSTSRDVTVKVFQCDPCTMCGLYVVVCCRQWVVVVSASLGNSIILVE